MRRVLVLISFLVLGIALIGWVFRGPISLRVMRAALEVNMAADRIGELPDGLHVTLCGAGGPLPDSLRSGPRRASVARESR
ncbi:MAG: hypothetical protein H8E78_05140 [Proteobacteria bacterium]|nr:hypothetical protein [Pseudomonadota bacterium]